MASEPPGTPAARDASAHDPERLRALLEALHRFPGPFYVSVIARTDADVEAALRATIQAAATGPLDAWERRPSSGGRYTSHRVTIGCQSVDEALALYVQVARVDGVVTVL